MNQNRPIKNKFRKLIPTSQSITTEQDFGHLRRIEETEIAQEQNEQPTLQSLKAASHQYINQNRRKKLRTVSSMNDKKYVPLKQSHSMLESTKLKQKPYLKKKTVQKSKQKISINNIMRLISQFKQKTQAIDMDITVQMEKQIKQEIILNEKILQITNSSQLSAAKLINIYFNRLKKQYKSFFFEQMYLYSLENIHKQQQKTSQQSDVYEQISLSDKNGDQYLQQYIQYQIPLNRDKIKCEDKDQLIKHPKINQKHKPRQNLLNVHKFLQIL